MMYARALLTAALVFRCISATAESVESFFDEFSNRRRANARQRHLLRRQLQSLTVADWQIGDITFQSSVDNVPGRFGVTFDHGVGAVGSAVRLEIYSDETSTTLLGNCFSQGGTLRGTISAAGSNTPTAGVDTDGYKPNIDSATAQFGKTTSYIWDFNTGIDQNTALYSESTDATGNTVATINFCVKLTLTDAGIDVNYKEYALKFSYTLDEAILESSAEVAPNQNVDADGQRETFAVTAQLCTATGVPTPILDPYSLAPGTPITLCVKSDDYPQASVVGIADLSFNASDIGVSQDSVENGTVSSYSYIEDPTLNAYGQYLRVQTLLLADFYPSTGFDTVNVAGLAQLRIGGDFTNGTRRRLQERQQPFQMSLRVSAAEETNDASAAANSICIGMLCAPAMSLTGLSLLFL